MTQRKAKFQLKSHGPNSDEYSEAWDLQNYEYCDDAAGFHLRFHLGLAKSIVEQQGFT